MTLERRENVLIRSEYSLFGFVCINEMVAPILNVMESIAANNGRDIYYVC